MRIFLMFTGIIMLLYGVSLYFLANFTIGTLLVLGTGLFLLLWGAFYLKIKEKSKTRVLKYLKISVVIILCFEIGLVSFVLLYGKTDTADYTEDAVIVLGAGIRGDKLSYSLKFRLDKAIEYHSKNPESLIVVSGGQGHQETVTEAYAMKKYLIKKGIEKNKIIMEEKATSTNENMRFSKVVLDKKFENEYKVVIITNNFHIYRAQSIAKAEGLENISHLHCSDVLYDALASYLRESLAIIKMWITD